jgi:hypothetical protein
LLLLLPPGVAISAPIVDGLAGTLYAMEASIRALVDQLPSERRARPTVAILGGGGYIGARLVAVLAPQHITATTKDSKDTLSLDVLLDQQQELNQPACDQDCVDIPVPDAICAIGTTVVAAPKSAYRQIVALDTRFAGNRCSEGAVLYTAEPADLQAADVVLVITRNGDDVAEYVQHATPGQVGVCVCCLPVACQRVLCWCAPPHAGCMAFNADHALQFLYNAS